MDFNSFMISWIPKVGALISLAGGALTSIGEPVWGTVLLSLGAALTGLSSRQDNKSSEDVKIKNPEVVIMVEPPVLKVIEKPFVPPPGHGGQR